MRECGRGNVPVKFGGCRGFCGTGAAEKRHRTRPKRAEPVDGHLAAELGVYGEAQWAAMEMCYRR